MNLERRNQGDLMRHSALRFASVGALNTLLTIAVIFLLRAVKVPDLPANLIGYVAGLICSFLLNKRWTFANDGPVLAAFTLFLVTFAGAYLLNLGIVLALLHLEVPGYFAHLCGMPFYTLAFYAGCRWFAFAGAKRVPT
jgi:putative flippase GtrA